MDGPRIALTLGTRTPENASSQGLYVEALEREGADVVVVRPGDPPPADIDGLCLSGGGDIDPREYGQTNAAGLSKDVDPRRDRLELDLVRDALGRDLPVFGICRGFQVINVALRGSLVQHVADHRPRQRADVVTHEGVRPASPSLLAQACGAGPYFVNSRHHQAVTTETLAPGLRPTVIHDGLVEAFESERHGWVVAVQWHPERSNEVAEPARDIFKAFVSAAARTVKTP